MLLIQAHKIKLNKQPLKKSNELNSTKTQTDINVCYFTCWGTKVCFFWGCYMHTHKHTLVIPLVTVTDTGRLQWRTSHEGNSSYLFSCCRDDDPLDTKLNHKGQATEVWMTVRPLHLHQRICDPFPSKPPVFLPRVTLCSPGPARRPLRQWRLLAPLPLPGTAPPSAAPQRCRPVMPTERRPPAGPASAAAVRTPKMPPW